jgi:hypothetical protein
MSSEEGPAKKKFNYEDRSPIVVFPHVGNDGREEVQSKENQMTSLLRRGIQVLPLRHTRLVVTQNTKSEPRIS